uniref:ACT domain-containing protein n=1 Tax=Candidatus Methanophaga sp. ANME-1 ERB7 TaxID=2759913 RepID=A0A7G9Z2E6_9EURY|nr:hypothetical protein IPKNHHKO_00004 [Methanosarcinales archaeon ANME-1 ERB7]
MRTITIVADDKVGLLADISYVLGKAKVNIESINGDVVSDKSVIMLSLSDAHRGKDVLEASGYKVAEVNSVVLRLKDEPGELARITNMLSQDGVSIQNVHMLSKNGRETVISVSVDKPKRASSVLREYLVAGEQRI